MYFLLFKTIIKNILVFFTSLYISFLIIEVLLIYTDLDRKSTRSGLQKIIEKKKSKINFDNRGLVEFYLDYKKKIKMRYYQQHLRVLIHI